MTPLCTIGWRAMAKKTQITLKEGDRVRVRVKALFGPGGKPGTMHETVVRVTPTKLPRGTRGPGGNLGKVRVLWDNGYEGFFKKGY